jgi:hypothetical protein
MSPPPTAELNIGFGQTFFNAENCHWLNGWQSMDRRSSGIFEKPINGPALPYVGDDDRVRSAQPGR